MINSQPNISNDKIEDETNEELDAEKADSPPEDVSGSTEKQVTTISWGKKFSQNLILETKIKCKCFKGVPKNNNPKIVLNVEIESQIQRYNHDNLMYIRRLLTSKIKKLDDKITQKVTTEIYW